MDFSWWIGEIRLSIKPGGIFVLLNTRSQARYASVNTKYQKKFRRAIIPKDRVYRKTRESIETNVKRFAVRRNAYRLKFPALLVLPLFQRPIARPFRYMHPRKDDDSSRKKCARDRERIARQ